MKDLFQRPSLIAKIAIGAFLALFVAGFINGAMAAEPNWTGFYLTGNLGYMNQTSRAVDDTGPAQFTFDVSTATDAVTGGGQVGFDVRLGRSNVVVGVLGSIDFTNADQKLSIASATVGDTEVSHIWAVGGRAGLLISPSVLLYASGGYAHAKMKTELGAATDNSANGYFVGGGVEAMLASGWSTRLDYRFIDLGNDTMQWAAPATAVADVDKNIHQVRLGISYKFEPAKEISSAAASLDPLPPARSTVLPKGKKIAP